MARRGRKSGAEIATAPPADLQAAREHPPAPEGMTTPERLIWNRVSGAMPAGWFKREHIDLLRAFCQHAARSDRFNQMASAIDPQEIGERIELTDLDRISKMAERESRAALALARTMRITHQAQIRPESAATKRDSVPADEKRPWER